MMTVIVPSSLCNGKAAVARATAKPVSLVLALRRNRSARRASTDEPRPFEAPLRWTQRRIFGFQTARQTRPLILAA
jgi:hypothetical protein